MWLTIIVDAEGIGHLNKRTLDLVVQNVHRPSGILNKYRKLQSSKSEPVAPKRAQCHQ